MTMISTYPTSIADNAASENWARYLYGKDRGHTDYLLHAARCIGTKPRCSVTG